MESKQEMISVIVPVYNVQSYIGQCIKSICRQEHQNLEIILIDDGSTDKSPNICDEYARIDSRINVIHKQNEGLVQARKDGMRIARGKYIAFVDGDDWIEPDMLGSLYSILIEKNVDIAMCGRYEDTGKIQKKVFHGFPEGSYEGEALREIIFPNMIVNKKFFEWGIFPGLWDKLFRREVLEPFQLMVDERLTMGEDAACSYPCILNAKSIFVLHKCLYHYRQTAFSMIKQSADKQLERKRFLILYQTVNEQFRKFQYIYDLRRQWKDYLLFLMTPRAGYLYEGIEELDFLFPFPEVKKGSNLVIYGMGTYGQLLYKFLLNTGFCKVVAAVDKNFVALRSQGIYAESPDFIKNYNYDAIVIASSFARARSEIYRDLISRFPVERIHSIDESLIKNDETMAAFGLL